MRRGKLSASKFSTSGFSLSSSSESEDPKQFVDSLPFKLPPPTDDIEQDSINELEYVLNCMKYCDSHPPQTGNVLDSPHYIVIVFESREQKDQWLKDCDLYRLGDKYLEAEYFASTFGIDLKKGTIKNKAIKKESKLQFSSGLNFGNFGPAKKEISETLKSIRKDERQLNDYLDWVVQSDFWLCLCFPDETQKANLLKALGLELEWDKYLWCHDVAKVVKLDLVPCTYKQRAFSGKQDPKLCELVKEQLKN